MSRTIEDVVNLKDIPKVGTYGTFENPIKPVDLDMSVTGRCFKDFSDTIAKYKNKVMSKLLSMCGYDWSFFAVNYKDFNIYNQLYFEVPITITTVYYKDKPLFEIYTTHEIIDEGREDSSYSFKFVTREAYHLFKNDGYGYYPVEVKLNID